jgi:hypothetical protein
MLVIHPNGIRMNLGIIRLRRKHPAQSIEGNVTLYCEGARNVIRTFTFAQRRRPNMIGALLPVQPVLGATYFGGDGIAEE